MLTMGFFNYSEDKNIVSVNSNFVISTYLSDLGRERVKFKAELPKGMR